MDGNPFPQSTYPVPGVTSGMIPSGLNYPVLSRNPIGWELEPAPSPLQQWVKAPPGALFRQRPGAGGLPSADDLAAADAGKDGLGIGTPVRICNITAHEMDSYNGLVGDIVHVHTTTADDGEEFLFDVRCPCQTAVTSKPRRRHGGEFSDIPDSSSALAAALQNRTQIAPVYGVSEAEAQSPSGETDTRLPPFVLMHRLPSEKLEALQ
eukprot:TRINITY_DN29841_c0_g1_i1.p1 TRINITY_DN29841_c0_g1~~TRINITY_DN29841_c0_g1_i1.p1  ORF type:complete len:241 (+),score=33.01 TRINITY_DN29841_c0_g1_i1:101-724(+)